MAKHASAPKIPALIYAISKKINSKTNHIYMPPIYDRASNSYYNEENICILSLAKQAE